MLLPSGMKAKHVIRALGIFLIARACLLPLHAQAVPGSDRVRIEVTVQSEEERKNLKGTHTDQITARKTLAIRLAGKAMNPERRLLRWQVYGKDLVTNKLAKVGGGDFPIALAKDGSQSIKSAQVTMTHTPDHILSHGKNREAGKVAGSGVKYSGYIVEVMDGEKVVGLASDPPGIEKRAAR